MIVQWWNRHHNHALIWLFLACAVLQYLVQDWLFTGLALLGFALALIRQQMDQRNLW